jgi:hypothetical protein
MMTLRLRLRKGLVCATAKVILFIPSIVFVCFLPQVAKVFLFVDRRAPKMAFDIVLQILELTPHASIR